MKKVLSIFLSIMMLTSVVAAADFSAAANYDDASVVTAVEISNDAAEESLPEEGKIFFYAENPAYYSDSEVMCSEVESTHYNAATTYVSVEEAIEQVRDYLEAHTSSFSVSYRIAKETSYMDWYYILDSAAEHTGVSTQGDYIHFSWKSCSGSYSYSGTGNGSEYNVTAKFSITYFTTASQEKELTSAVANVIKGFDFTSSTSDYDKILTIYDYVCNNVTYDYKNLDDDSYLLKQSAYAALINGTAVCEGYAVLLYRLMLECGINCRIIECPPDDDNVAHVWNIVKLGTLYYNVDATWDAGNNPYKYFLKCNSTFSNSQYHTRLSEYDDSTFNEVYPMATSDHTEATDDTVEKSHNFSIVKTLTSPTCEHHGFKVIECSNSGCYERYTEQISATGHSWGSGAVTKAATCTNTGTRTYTCSACAATHTEQISAKGHKWNSGVVTRAATCTSTGTRTYTCSSCAATYRESIAKKAHTYKTVTQKAKISGNIGTNGSIKKYCTACNYYASYTPIYSPSKMSLSTSSYTYNGKAKKPTVTVKDSLGNKISSKYYTVSYINQSTGKKVSSMKKPGKYYVKVTFKTRYSGSIKKAVTIKPKKTSIKSIKASKKGFTVKWEKKADNVTGYQVQYSTSKSFKNKKTITIKKTGTTSKKVTKLKAKKKYYVRVRTYKTVKINGKSTKIYSGWSSVKGVTTKK